MVCVRTIVEHAKDLRRVCRTDARIWQEHRHELRILKDEFGVGGAGCVALDRASPEEMRVALQRRDVEAADVRSAGPRDGIRLESEARSRPALDRRSRVKHGDL